MTAADFTTPRSHPSPLQMWQTCEAANIDEYAPIFEAVCREYGVPVGGAA